MSDNYLITGYHGTPHVTAENDRGINAGICGTGRFVLPVGEQFRSEYIGNNIVRMYDGKLLDNGAAAGIPAGEYIDFLIPTASQGKKRNDLIVFQYEKDASTLIESGSFVIVQGEETSGTPTDPELIQEDLLTNTATKDQMAMFRVVVTDTTIGTPVKVFQTYGAIEDISADFITKVADGFTAIANVFKKGNHISGDILIQGDFVEWEGASIAFSINEKYSPMCIAVASIYTTNGYSTQPSNFSAYIAFKTLSVSPCNSVNSTVAMLGFSYFCQ